MKVKKYLFNFRTVYFLSGAIVSAALGLLFGKIAERYFGIFLIFLSLYILYSIKILVEIKTQIGIQLGQFELNSDWVDNEEDVYKKSIEIVHFAEKCILALGPYTPDIPNLKMPVHRVKYLEAIEKYVEKRLKNFPIESSFTRELFKLEKTLLSITPLKKIC